MNESGFTVFDAGNADEAIGLLELNSNIHVMFTDIHMPGSMDGLKMAHYVRGRWPPIKFLITSGIATPQAKDMPPGSRFMSKPYRLGEVVETLREIVG